MYHQIEHWSLHSKMFASVHTPVCSLLVTLYLKYFSIVVVDSISTNSGAESGIFGRSVRLARYRDCSETKLLYCKFEFNEITI